jgi:predicted SAM-dependent methyltransferase
MPSKYDKIHYACGNHVLPGWLNADVVPTGPENYMQVNLTSRHPFPANSFRFGYAQDFLEHIDQAESLVFLSEVHRTLRPRGVLRLSFPGLEGVLNESFSKKDFDSVLRGRHEAYTQHQHRHFYSRESLAIVAAHFGFDLAFVEYKQSSHAELVGIDSRAAQVNIRAELTKQ